MGLVALCCASALNHARAWGDAAADQALLESAMPGRSASEGLLSLSASGNTTTLSQFFSPSPTKTEVDLSNAFDGLSLKRSLTQERVTAAGNAFNFGLLSKVSTEAGMTLFGRTKLNFSTSTDTLTNLDQDLLSSKTTNVLGLQQGFGSGVTNGTLGFSRTTVTTSDPNHAPRDEITQMVNLSANLRAGLSNTTAFTTKSSSDGSGAVGQDWTTKFAAAFSGGAGAFAFGQSDYTQAGVRTVGTTMDLSAPITIFGNKLTLTRHSNDFTTDGALASRNDGEGLSLPFMLSGGKAMLNFSTTDKSTPGLIEVLRKMDIVTPVKFAGQTVNFERHVNEDTQNGVETGTDVTKFLLPLKLTGGAGQIAYTATDTVTAGVQQGLSQFYLSLPLAFQHRTYLFERRNVNTDTGGVDAEDLTTKMAGPLPFLSKTAVADYTVVTHTQVGADSETRTAHLATPLNLLGRAISTDFVNTTQDTATSRQSAETMKIAAPMLGQSLSIQHQTITTDSAGTDTTQTITQVVTPKLALLDKHASIGARMMRTDTSDAPTQQVTGVDVAATPTKPLTLQGSFVRDTGTTTEGFTKTLTSTYAPSNQLSLNARYLQTEAANQAPTFDRRVLFTAKPTSKLGLEMTGGVISWAQNGAPPDTARQASAKLGNAKKLTLAAEYKEVSIDPAGNIVPLTNPVVNIALMAGDPAHMALQLKCVEATGQPTRERDLGLQFPALGGNMKLGYSENAADPRNPAVIRLAKLYDANIERQVFGTVKLNLGLRYCDLQAQPQDDLFGSVQVSGGNVKGGGEIKLSYLSGDFVPTPQAGQTLMQSTLDLSFNRQLSADGKLGLTLKRTTGLPYSGVQPDTEGRVEYTSSF